MARRYYSSTAARTTLAAGVDDSTTTFTVVAVSGWPASFPYTLIIDQDTINEEVVSVTNRSGTTLTVSRAQDGTSAVAHSAGAAVNHGVSARDFNEPNQFLNEGGTVTGETVVSSSGSGNTLEVRNAGTGNSLVVEDSANPDATPFVVDAGGRLLIGHTTSQSLAVGGGIQLSSTGAQSYIEQVRFIDSSASPGLGLGKARGSSWTSASAVAENDALGELYFRGYDGSAWLTAAQILALVDGTPGSGDMPGRLVFRTTADGSSTATERMRITSAGNVGIGTGSPAQKLEVSGAASTDGSAPVTLRISDTTSSSSWTANAKSTALQFYSDDGTVSSGTAGARVRSEIANVHPPTTAATSDLVFSLDNGTNTGLYERMRITSAGSVGIGTSSPGTLLQINNNAGSGAIFFRTINSSTDNNTTKFGEVDLWGTDTVGSGKKAVAIRYTPEDANVEGSSLSLYTRVSDVVNERMKISGSGLITGSGTSLGAWTSYTPTLGGTGWALGNGTITAAYCQVGKIVIMRVEITFGSTSTYGASAALTCSLPVTAKTGMAQVGTFGCYGFDSSLSAHYELHARGSNTTTLILDSLGASGALASLTATSPITWATSDVIRISGVYEAA